MMQGKKVFQGTLCYQKIAFKRIQILLSHVLTYSRGIDHHLWTLEIAYPLY